MPDSLKPIFAGATARLVWRNQLGGLTWELVDARGSRFLKWAPAAGGIALDREAARLAWAGRFANVPAVLDQGASPEGTWMLTAAIPGTSAVTERWRAAPEQAVSALGRGLRALHDCLPVDVCPFDWSAESRLGVATQRAQRGEIRQSDWHPTHQDITLDRALAMIADIPPTDRLVVCHGDACAPNTIIDESGDWSGHVDLGALGVADRWADLAIATWSTQWNYGPGFEELLLSAYGVDPDPIRTAYYRLLWDLGP